MYEVGLVKQLCFPNEDTNLRHLHGHDCNTDKACLRHVRDECDDDPNCYGVAYYKDRLGSDIKICTDDKNVSHTMQGWRTMLKRGIDKMGCNCLVNIRKI